MIEMKKNFEFKNSEYTAKVEVELTNDNVFTASGYIYNGRVCDRNMMCGGQCIEELKELFNGNTTVDIIYQMWKKHHLNNMHPGTEKQEEALTNGGYTAWANNYTECCDYLKSIGLYEDNGYKFGCGWLKREIPEKDLEIIRGLLS